MRFAVGLLACTSILTGAAAAGLTREAAEAAAAEAWEAWAKQHRPALAGELENKAFLSGDHTMRFHERRFGEAPEGGHALFISLHGGGGAPEPVNTRQWHNQIRLYEPEEGIVVAPRAPGNTWDLWHQAHIDPLFDRLIQAFVVTGQVNPDRVYLLGYSAGGDGVFQVAPRMADRFAAASMMAGHPNETQPDGLYNLPFSIWMGGKDAAYKRNQVAAEWKEKLEALHSEHPGGYEHLVTIYPETGHWMSGKDRAALPWMQQYTRTAWPKKVVWLQDNVTHDRFYWLGVPEGQARKGDRLMAEIDGQTIRLSGTLEAAEKVHFYLHDALIDLDQPVRVVIGDTVAGQGPVRRSQRAVQASLATRPDPSCVATAFLSVDWPRD